MFQKIVERNISALAALETIKRQEITPYNLLKFSRSPTFQDFDQELFSALLTFKNVIQEMKNGEYKWEKGTLAGTWKYTLTMSLKVFNSMAENPTLDLIQIKTSVPPQKSTLSNYFDPLSMQILVQSIVEIYEHKELTENIALINLIFESFLKFVFSQDTKWLPYIDSMHINLTDPFTRINIRKSNRANTKFAQKYFCADFNLKKFVMNSLEILFEAEKMKKHHLRKRLRLNFSKLVLAIFELGLWTPKEVPKLLDVLHFKVDTIRHRGSAHNCKYSDWKVG
jgi:hypothetical protein